MYQLAYLKTRDQLEAALRAAGDKIAPVWPLESYVAVNPYMGLSEKSFADAARELRDVAGARMVMPLDFYLDALADGSMERRDVRAALDELGLDTSAEAFLDQVSSTETGRDATSPRVPTVAAVASELTDRRWSAFVTDRVSSWASSYFDDGQAAWRPNHSGRTLYECWRDDAEHDRTPEILGLDGFRDAVARLPSSAMDAAAEALSQLHLPETGLDLYLHRLLMQVGGWSAFSARFTWESRVHHDRPDDTIVEFLAVLLSYEVALLECLADDGIESAWKTARVELAVLRKRDGGDHSLEHGLVLHRAYERGAERRMCERIDAHSAPPSTSRDARAEAQAVFCIDVRSETFRRHLEATSDDIETIGFAGFFGFPIEYVPLGYDDGGAQCPVLLPPSHRVRESVADGCEERARQGRSLSREVGRAWKAFKMGAISCFSFVGPVGLAYLPKLVSDSFGWTRPVARPSESGLDREAAARLTPAVEPANGDPSSGISLDDRVDIAESTLRGMSLTDDFARVVLLAGHGSENVNNPHASALNCGACGGRSGEPNARVAAAVLNDPQVRSALEERGIAIPDDTLFVAGLHDTTTDKVTIFGADAAPPTHRADLDALQDRLDAAGRACRAERARRLHLLPGEDPHRHVESRSRDWAQTRPEWGLAGCTSFVIAPRRRTRGFDLDGSAFLHSYDWQEDAEFAVLEQIMTAPMIVASWINLQYYASTVDPAIFGAGNKTLHNVVGNVGVIEGNGGDLRVGLPHQSVHDGETFQHRPQRLRVVIEAPIEAMNDVIRRHRAVRELADNGWLTLFAMDEDGDISHRYDGQLAWQGLNERTHEVDTRLGKAV